MFRTRKVRLLWAPPAKDQHPILEMESLTEEEKNRGSERNGSWPNRQPK
jgi:hypothetical protein